MTAPAESQAVVIRISPMAHFISAFMALSMLVFVPVFGEWFLALLVVPVDLSVAIERLRTSADREAVTARSLLGGRRVAWADLEGLRFSRGGWARACLRDGGELTLPAVTFATLPRLAAASGGRVPDPYRREPDPEPAPESAPEPAPESAEGVGAVQGEPGRDAPGDAEHQGQE